MTAAVGELAPVWCLGTAASKEEKGLLTLSLLLEVREKRRSGSRKLLATSVEWKLKAATRVAGDDDADEDGDWR